jgi:hypothetical protein
MKKDVEIYELLRTFHNKLKPIIREAAGGDSRKLNALEALHSVLYMVEEKFTNF